MTCHKLYTAPGKASGTPSKECRFLYSPPMNNSRILRAIYSQPWAITQDWLDTIIAIASREPRDLEAIQSQLGRPLENSRRTTVRGDVAIIPIVGPLMRRANLFSEISGATSAELLARDLGSALRDPAVRRIVLDVDSPGGEVNGINELAQMIYEGRKQKPITAFVGGLGASAAYWLAANATEVVVDATAMVGSIGVIAAMPSAKDEAGDLEFTSADSPNKRPDPSTTAGREQIQRLIDDTYSVFVESVARGRGVTSEAVRADFGRGGMFVGQHAVTAGLADRVGTLEGLLAGTPSAERPRIASPALTAASGPGLSIAASGAAPLHTQGVPMTDIPQAQDAPVAQDAPLIVPPIVEAALPPLTPPTVADPAVQAQVNAVVQQMTAQFEQQRRLVLEQAQAQFQQQLAQMQAEQAVTAYAQHLTTPTLNRPHALPGATEDYRRFLMGLSAPQRATAQGLFDTILNAGLVAFDEIGTSGEGASEKTAEENYNAAVAAKQAGGLSRHAAIQAVQREQPAIYEAYRNGGR